MDVTEFPPEIRVSDVVVAVWESEDMHVAIIVPKSNEILSRRLDTFDTRLLLAIFKLP
jgi:hypothetical protein